MPLSAFDLINEAPAYFKGDPALAYYWMKVQRQAARHMRRLETNELFDITRPNESDDVKDFRDSVRRDITVDGPWKWISKVSRIFIEHGISLDEATLSEVFSEWIASKPFTIAGKEVDLMTYLYEFMLPFVIEDPNGALVPLPIIPGVPTLAPITPEEDGGIPLTERLDVMNVIVPSGRIVFQNDSVFSWKAGMWRLPDKDGTLKPYYFIVDKFAYWRYIPVLENHGINRNTTKVKYQLFLWYPHELGTLPVNINGGVMSRPGDVDFYKEAGQYYKPEVYYESFLRNYFELADEVTMRFSDSQAVWIQHAFPKMVMGKIPCPNRECTNGKVMLYDQNGNKSGFDTCPACHGKQYIDNPGPYNVLVREDPGANGVADNKPTIEMINPSVDILKHSDLSPWELLDKAKRSIGLDLLIAMTESSLAMKERAHDLNDLLRKVSHSFFGFVTRHFELVEALLQIEEDKRSDPRVRMPSDLQYRTPELLKEEAEKSLTSDRFQSRMDFYSKKYMNNPTMVRIYELVLMWAPIVMATAEEIGQNLAWGVYKDADLIKRDRAFIIFRQIANEAGRDFLTMDLDKLYAQADEILKPFIPEQRAPAQVSFAEN